MSCLVRQCLHRSKSSKISVAAGLVLLIALLVSCGTYASGQGAQPQASSTASSQGTQSPISTPTPTVSSRVQNCGRVETALNGQPSDTNKAKLSENCFWQAFQHCQPATLNFAEHSLDTEANHTFTIKSNNGKCLVSDTVKNYIVPNHLTSTRTYTCGNLLMQADGLHFASCGSIGSIHVPA